METKNKIYEVHGVKVMIDRDLAGAIDYETKVLNQLVRRNINKFESSDYFQISLEEFNVLKSQIVTSNVVNRGGVRHLPYVFTKEGIRTLSTILRKENIKEIIDKILEKFDDKNELTLSNNNSLIPVNTGNSYQNMIYEIRGQLVMLDSDLASLYNCANGTKDINKAVNRNKDRFPNDFYFQLSEEKFINLKFHFGTSSLNSSHGGVRKLPYVFTEQGVAMLATVLKTPVADAVSMRIIDAFVYMRRYLSGEIGSNMLVNHEERILKLEEQFNKFSSKRNTIIYEGKIYDAYSVMLDIFNEAKGEIIIVDNYVNKELLDILREVDKKIIVISNNMNNELIKKYESQYDNTQFVSDNPFHDRYIILDRKEVYASGMSLKDVGKKYSYINKIEESIFINELTKRIIKILK